MPRGSYESYIFTVDNVNVGVITLNSDVMNRFNITGLTTLEAAAATAGTKRVRPHERRVFQNRNTASTTKNTTVSAFRRADIKRKNRTNAGKKIKVPLGFPLTDNTPSGRRAQPRMTTINFPLRASNYQVARWINVHFTANKPSFFVTPAGAKFPVNIPQIIAQTAGEDDGDEGVEPS